MHTDDNVIKNIFFHLILQRLFLVTSAFQLVAGAEQLLLPFVQAGSYTEAIFKHDQISRMPFCYHLDLYLYPVVLSRGG